MNRKILFAPSLMCMDQLHVEDQLKILNERADLYHVDIMDGNYVKNFSLAPAFVESIRPYAKLPIDMHLMVLHPGDYIEVCAKSGTDYITPHADTITKDAFRVMNQIKDLGCKTGVAVNPSSSLEEIKYYIHLLDKITVMTVDAGFAGQKFIPQMLDKVRQLVEIRKEKKLSFLIEVDGSCNENTYKQLYDAGVDVMIVGTSGLFKLDNNLSLAWEKMMKKFDQCVNS